MSGTHNAQKFKLVGLWCDHEFLAKIDEARGETTRSQFLRDTLSEKLASLGYHIPREKTIAPDRAGKGGPNSKSESAHEKYRTHAARTIRGNKTKSETPPKS